MYYYYYYYYLLHTSTVILACMHCVYLTQRSTEDNRDGILG